MKKRAVTGFGLSLLVLFGLALFFYLSFTSVVVSGHSMEPTFQNGQRLLACKAYWLVGAIKDNDIVVVKRPGSDYIIKRVFRSQGEVVDWVNAPEGWKLTQGEFVVPQGMVFVIGDNRPVSEDSRTFGPVPTSQVIGKILRR